MEQCRVLGTSEAKTETSVAPGRRLSATVPENVGGSREAQPAECLEAPDGFRSVKVDEISSVSL